MKKQIGTHEAKAYLSEILQKVKLGEEFTITNRGEPVALLIPYTRQENNLGEVISTIKNLRKKNKLGKISIRELINEGRKY